MLNWLGEAIRDFYAGYGWVPALFTLVLLLIMVAATLWLFDVPVGAILERWLAGEPVRMAVNWNS